MWRGTLIGAAFALLFVAVVSGHAQRPPATMTDLLLEIRALRGDLSQSLSATVRSQVIVGRVQMQEQRIAAIKRELTCRCNCGSPRSSASERTYSRLTWRRVFAPATLRPRERGSWSGSSPG
jgi:hypothetical protein